MFPGGGSRAIRMTWRIFPGLELLFTGPALHTTATDTRSRCSRWVDDLYHDLNPLIVGGSRICRFEMLRWICIYLLQIQPSKHVPDSADHTAPTGYRELDQGSSTTR